MTDVFRMHADAQTFTTLGFVGKTGLKIHFDLNIDAGEFMRATDFPRPTLVDFERVTGYVRSDGRMYDTPAVSAAPFDLQDPGQLGVLLPTNDPDLNLENNVSYHVSFEQVHAGTFREFDIPAPSATTAANLASFAPGPGQPVTGIPDLGVVDDLADAGTAGKDVVRAVTQQDVLTAAGAASATGLSNLAAQVDPGTLGSDGYVMLGQSNNLAASGALNPLIDVTPPRVKQWPTSGSYIDTEIVGSEPLYHLAGQFANAIGYGGRFADRAVRKTPAMRNVTIIPCGYGSTGLHPGSGLTWDPADNVTTRNLFNESCAHTDLFLAQPGNAVKCFFWQQGEWDSESSTYANAYAAALSRVINAIRSHYGSTMPIIIGSMNPDRIFTYGPSTYKTVTEAHANAARLYERVWFFYGPFGHYTADSPTAIHYDGAGQRIMGDRYWDAYDRFVKANVIGKPPAVPAGMTLAQTGTTVTGFINPNPGRVTNYLIEYKINSGSWTTLVRDSINPYFEIPSMTLGATIQVRISTINETGQSAPCTPASIVMDTIPGQVTGLTAGTPGSYSQPLTWSSLMGSRSYLVEYKAHSSSTWLTSATVTTTSATVSGLLATTNYDYRVTAINYAGTSTTPSATVSATTDNPTPLATAVGVTPVGAYGLRQLKSGYTGNLIRVRRSSDNTEQDIGQVGGLLDTSSMSTFAAGGSLFVKTVYDQSGNGRDATQATTTKQPRIMNAGVLDTVGGVAAMYFNGANALTAATGTGILPHGSGSLLAICTPPADNTILAMDNSAGSAGFIHLWADGSLLEIKSTSDANTSVFFKSTGGRATGSGLHQYSTVYDPAGGTTAIYQDAATILAGAMAASTTATTTSLTIGAGFGGGALYFNGYIAEVSFFFSPLTTVQRQAGEANQKGYAGTP